MNFALQHILRQPFPGSHLVVPTQLQVDLRLGPGEPAAPTPVDPFVRVPFAVVPVPVPIMPFGSIADAAPWVREIFGAQRISITPDIEMLLAGRS